MAMELDSVDPPVSVSPGLNQLQRHNRLQHRNLHRNRHRNRHHSQHHSQHRSQHRNLHRSQLRVRETTCILCTCLVSTMALYRMVVVR